MKCYCVFENTGSSGIELPSSTRIVVLPLFHALQVERSIMMVLTMIYHSFEQIQ